MNRDGEADADKTCGHAFLDSLDCRGFLVEPDPDGPLLGREPLLAKLDRALDLVASVNPRGMTQVVCGAYDVGKHTFMRRAFRKRRREWGAMGKTVVLADEPIGGYGERMKSSSDVANRLLRSVWMDRYGKVLDAPPMEWLPEEMSGATMSACLNVCAEMWGDDTVLITTTEWSHPGRRMKPRRLWREVMGALHERKHNARILPVLWGGPDTAHVVGRYLGLRLNPAHVHRIECLPHSDSAELLIASMNRAGLSWDDAEWRAHLTAHGFTKATWAQWRARMLEAVLSDCESHTPWELGEMMRSICQALLDRMGEMSPDGSVPMGGMSQRYGKWRRRHYREVYRDGGMGAGHWMFGALMHIMGQSLDGMLPKSKVLEVITELFQVHREESGVHREESDGDTARKMLDNAYRSGVLERRMLCGEEMCGPSSVPGAVLALRQNFDRYAQEDGRYGKPVLELMRSRGWAAHHD